MGQKAKKRGKQRLDAYYRLAKDQGYRARSAFKLIQLNRKYDFLSKARVAVDLCAAPGGWCQVCAKYMPMGSKIIGVDLDPIAPIRGVKTFVGDITDEKTKKTIQMFLKKEPVDIVIHDGAPNVGGAWARDLFQQNALVLCALKLACQLLKPDGWFVSKVFRSPDYQKLIWVLKQFFEKVEATKPLASRMESAEIFVVCAGYKAPKIIDPKMFSAQEVFSEVGPEKILTGRGTFQVPKSNVPMGYDDFMTVVHRTATLQDFMSADDPKAFLKHYHEIRFGPEDQPLLNSKWSKKEYLHLCQDLQQVGDADKRRLARWREQLLREQSKARLAAGGLHHEEDDGEGIEISSDVADDGEHEPVDDATRMAEELLAIRKAQAKAIKNKQRKIVDRKLKQVRGLINYDPHESTTEAAPHQELFDSEEEGSDLSEEGEDSDANFADDPSEWTIGKLTEIPEGDMAEMFDRHFEEPDAKLNLPLDAKMTVEPDSDQEFDFGDASGKAGHEVYEGQPLQLEEGNEEAADVDNYGNYIPAFKPQRLEQFHIEGDEDEEAEEEEDPEAKKKRKREEKLDEAGKQSKWKRHHVNVESILNETFPKPRDLTRKRNKKVLEEELVELHDPNASDSDSGAPNRRKQRKEELEAGRLRDESSDSDETVSELPSEDLSDGEDVSKMRLNPDKAKLTTAELIKAKRKEVKKSNKEIRKEKQLTGSQKKGKKGKKEEDTSFQEVPMAMVDPDVRARTLAIATKMLDKKSRREILEGSINRYTHNDDDDLPDWFIKDENRNCKIFLPVTAAEIDAQRARFTEMNSRPSKKVMEAMGRKRRKAQRILRSTLEKAKTDPRVRDKAKGLTLRTLMRSKAVKGGHGKKKVKLDGRSRGEKKREKHRVAKLGKKNRR